MGGTIRGSHGGPMVVIMVPSIDVLLPKPQVGQTRSLRLSDAIPYEIGKPTKLPLGSCQISLTAYIS